MFSRRLFALGLLLLPLLVRAAELPNPWQKEVLLQTPTTYPAPGLEQQGMEALFYETLPWEGKPTRSFAYIGIPERPAGGKVPAMVLVHGGGGTAYPAWVRLWTSRGYAAIAMDTCGTLPTGETGKHPHHEFGGPAGWGGWNQVDKAPEDQWTYHAVADVLLAHSLLRSRPEVDASRIGVTGISWGGYLTCIVAGVDDRFRFAAPVYGCGFLGDNSAWLGQFEKLGPEAAKLWLQRWDPSVYLPRAKLPMLWVTGTNDFAYPMDSLQKSYRLPPGPRTLCIRVRMPHAHGGAGENPEEIHAFANHYLKGGPGLMRIGKPAVHGGLLRAGYVSGDASGLNSGIPAAKAELNFTRETGPWQKRTWETIPARLWSDPREVMVEIPEGACVAYFNLFDANGLVVSSEHIEFPAPPE
jgi:dienelactone hydrolase